MDYPNAPEQGRQPDFIERLACLLDEAFPHMRDRWDDNVQETARRVWNFWMEYSTPGKINFNVTTFPYEGDQMIVVRDIEFASICAHHLLPFTGLAYVGYVTHKQMIGLSKIPRIVDVFSKRPNTQEQLTEDIAAYLKRVTEAKGVAVVMHAQHTCMCARGVRKTQASMVTSVMKGIFLTAPAARQEFLSVANLRATQGGT